MNTEPVRFFSNFTQETYTAQVAADETEAMRSYILERDISIQDALPSLMALAVESGGPEKVMQLLGATASVLLETIAFSGPIKFARDLVEEGTTE